MKYAFAILHKGNLFIDTSIMIENLNNLFTYAAYMTTVNAF